jgi:predicted nucleic acid-binding protein
LVFWDTSALVKAYTNELGSPTVRAVIDRFDGRLAASDFVALEVLSTLSKQVRSNQLGKKSYRTARTDFLSDFPRIFHVVEVDTPVKQLATALTDSFREHSVGTLDLLHVATALHLQPAVGGQPLVVASSDAGFLRLADACGLKTFNPEREPLGSLLAVWR